MRCSGEAGASGRIAETPVREAGAVGRVLWRVGEHVVRTRGKPARRNALALAALSVAVDDDKKADRGDAGHGD